MIEDESDFAADTMAQMMAVSDAAMSSYLVNEIANIEATTDAGANLAMDVLASILQKLLLKKWTELYPSKTPNYDGCINYLMHLKMQQKQDIGMMSRHDAGSSR